MKDAYVIPILQKRAGKVLLSPVRGALPTNLELQYYSRADERSNRTTGSTKGFSLVLAFHNPRAVATVASFLPPKRLLPPAYLPTYLPPSSANTTMIAYKRLAGRGYRDGVEG